MEEEVAVVSESCKDPVNRKKSVEGYRELNHRLLVASGLANSPVSPELSDHRTVMIPMGSYQRKER
jgi:hypothetical protein